MSVFILPKCLMCESVAFMHESIAFKEIPWTEDDEEIMKAHLRYQHGMEV